MTPLLGRFEVDHYKTQGHTDSSGHHHYWSHYQEEDTEDPIYEIVAANFDKDLPGGFVIIRLMPRTLCKFLQVFSLAKTE